MPALRKRLQSESRTLSKRMSAISLSGDEVVGVGGTFSPYNGSESMSSRHNTPTPSSNPPQHHYQPRQPNGSNSLDYSSHSGAASATTSSHPNTAKKPSTTAPNGTAFQRSRTYSQPDSALKMNRSTNGSRPPDPKPTRIPKPSTRTYGNYSNGNTPTVPQTNGFANSPPHPEQEFGQYHDHRSGTYSSNFTTSSLTSKSIVGLTGSTHPGLLHESPPFPPSSSATSLAYTPTTNGYHHHAHGEAEEFMDAAPSRQSMESEEQPFEHWYRGEVSRNGGVGELRVGKRQEMLDIANYGHLIRSANANAKRKAAPGEWENDAPYREERTSQHYSSGRGRHRKRAGSIGGLTEAERVRGSVYFDEANLDAVGRVLDENPLTDLDDDYTSDVASLSSYNRVEHDYIPGVGDISTTTTVVAPNPYSDVAVDMHLTPRMDDRSTTPTPMSQSQRGQYPPTRIPGPSKSRQSTETRAETPSTLNTSTRSTVNVSTSSTSKTPSPPLVAPSANGKRSVSGQSVGGGPGKRGVSPATPNAKRRMPVKSLRGKQTPVKLPSKEQRESVGQYPSPGEGEDMADAIPTWTQPVPRTGNWDEVVLPVVARNKGLDGQYTTADGSPQPKKIDNTPAPAPGTFGFKYRPMRHSDEFIPMDEFGRPDQVQEERPRQPQMEEQGDQDQDHPSWPPQDSYNKHEQTRLPARGGTPPPSPPPFAHYAPNPKKGGVDAMHVAQPPTNHQRQERIPEEESAGCCKCTIM